MKDIEKFFKSFENGLSTLVVCQMLISLFFSSSLFSAEVKWLAEVQQPPKVIPRENLGHLEPLLQTSTGQKIKSLATWNRQRVTLLKQWQTFLGPMPKERPTPKYKVISEEKLPKCLRQLVEYEGEPGQKVQGYLLIPRGLDKTKQHPALVALHATTTLTIKQISGIEGNARRKQGLQLCQRGFVVFCPENFLWQAPTLNDAVKKFHQRHPRTKGMQKMIYDAMRGVDLLEALPFVDKNRIGAFGHSLGAKEVLYLAAFDERIQVAVASEGGLGFHSTNWEAPWYLGKSIHQKDFQLNHHQLLALTAPRAMLVLGGETGRGAADGDRSWALIEAALPVYALYKRPVHLGLYNHHEGHDVSPKVYERVEEWFVTYLRLEEDVIKKQATLKAGAAAVDITPSKGVSMNGTISKPGLIRGVHDSISSRALVLDDGKTKLAIVVNDLCMVQQTYFDQAKVIIEKKTGIPRTHILMAATHTHAAPRVPYGRLSTKDDKYYQTLILKMAESVIQANNNLSPAQIGWGSFQKPELIKCRRFLCQPGTVEPNPFGIRGERVKSVAGKSSGIIGPAGPVDAEFSILSIQHTDGKPLAVLGNFSVHYCGGYKGTLVSADYFGYYARWMEKQLDGGSTHPPFVGIMSNGTSGNTGAVQISMIKPAPFERLQLAGRILAEQSLKQIKEIKHQQQLPLGMLESQLTLTIRRPDAARLKWAKSILEEKEKKKHPHRWSHIYANEAIALSQMPEKVTIKIQAIRIGDILIGAAPCEVFAETGLAIKKSSPQPATFTMELANGYYGYLPPAKQHNLGGYETWPARSSLLEVDAETKIRKEVIRLLKKVITE